MNNHINPSIKQGTMSTDSIILYLIFSVIIALLLQQSSCVSSKLAITPNNDFNASSVTILPDITPTNTASGSLTVYTFALAAHTDTSTSSLALGVIGSDFAIEPDLQNMNTEIGFKIFNVTLQSATVQFEMESKYELGRFNKLIIRYVTSRNPHIDINYLTIEFDLTDQVYDTSATGGSYLGNYYRETDVQVSYNSKLSGQSITGGVTLVGFYAQFPENQTEAATNLSTTVSEVFGLNVTAHSFQSDKMSLKIRFYSLASLQQISVYYFSFQKKITTTQFNHTMLGNEYVGCQYHQNLCDNLTVALQNNHFNTSDTYVNQFIEDTYFYGINQFIFYRKCESNGNSTSQTVCYDSNFKVIDSSLASNNEYKTNIEFLGNPQPKFNLRFMYLIDLQTYCDVISTDKYYLPNFKQCASSCGDKYYQNDTDNLCYPCDSQCKDCEGPDRTQCKACYTGSQERALTGTQCLCKDGWFDDGVTDKCIKCSHTCLTCDGSSDSSCLTCDLTDHRFDDNNRSCPCENGYFENGADTCDKCHYSCETCESGGGKSSCTACEASKNRTIDTGSNQCLCNSLTFDDGSDEECKPCHYSCQICKNTATKCQSCDSAAHRTLSSQKCNCETGYYDANQTECEKCNDKCKGCNGPEETDCTVCDETGLSRKLSNSRCLCMERYYEDNETCHLCHYSCLNCTSDADSDCTVCEAADERDLDSTTSQCLCRDGFFDDFNNSPCLPCRYSCQTCLTTLNNCLSCSSSEHRVLQGSSCPCQDGYAEVGTTCEPCHYSCLTCSSNTMSTCLTCDTNYRSLDSSPGECLCLTHTYDNNSVVCRECHIRCTECLGQDQSSCTQCDSLPQRVLRNTSGPTGPCLCEDGYFQNGSFECQICDHKCLTCNEEADNCTSCELSDHRQINSHVCECMDNYYDDGGAECPICKETCQTCVFQTDNCVSCINDRVLEPSSSNTSKCVCEPGKYEEPAGQCLDCSAKCETCRDTADECLTCFSLSNRDINNLACICKFGYYQLNSNDENCTKCPYFCQNCTDGPICLECEPTSYRDLLNDECKCMDGYYNYGIDLLCKKCSDICVKCINSSTLCTECYETTQYRQLNSGECVCLAGYYDNFAVNGDPVCQLCHHRCVECSGGNETDCQICKPNRQQDNVTQQCPCQKGYYENSADLDCYPCHISCQECVNSPTYCTSCVVGQHVENNNCVCSVLHHFKQAVTGVCLPCSPTCKSCEINDDRCTQCYVGSQNRVLIGNDCICITSDSVYDDNVTLKCEPCHYSCVECSGPTEHECTRCDNVTRELQSSSFECGCMSKFYESFNTGTGQLECLACIQECLVCYGGSQFQCNQCTSGYTLIGTYCQPNVVCTKYYYSGVCVTQCPAGTYPLAGTCLKCTNSCYECTSDTTCLSCVPGAFLNSTSSICELYCPVGYYSSTASKTCEVCPLHCTKCIEYDLQAICSECQTGYFMMDSVKCMDTCPSTHVLTPNSFCVICAGHCQTCSASTVDSCLSCKEGASLLGTRCYTQCPSGFFSNESLCIGCTFPCETCSGEECLSCADGYYLTVADSQPRNCIEHYHFYDSETGSLQTCHPNCLSCTNTSFSSCIQCASNRGDESNLAVSGYCDCQLSSIEVGNGSCDTEKYIAVSQANQVLVSTTYGTVFLSTLTSIISTNYVLVLGMVNYAQVYSAYYYLNSSLIMQIDGVLKSYQIRNAIGYAGFSQATQSNIDASSNRRLLQRVQSNESLFLRGNSFLYLVQWGQLIFWITVGIWGLDLLVYFLLRCCGSHRSSRVHAFQHFDSHIDHEHPPPRAKGSRLQQQMSKSFEMSDLTTDPKTITGKLTAFYSVYHESAAILVHLMFATEFTFYAAASFKMLLTSSYEISIVKTIGSIAFGLYLAGYTLRMIVGGYLDSEKRSELRSLIQIQAQKDENLCPHAPSNSGKSDKLNNSQTPLTLLYFLQCREKSHFLQIIFLPVLVVRNQIIMILMVVLSADASYQLYSSIGVMLLFIFYSLCCNPYRGFIRFFMHLHELLFLGQLLALLVCISRIQIDYQYIIAWALIGLNYAQLILFMSFTIVLLFHLGRKQLCKKNTVKPIDLSRDMNKHQGIVSTEQYHENDQESGIKDLWPKVGINAYVHKKRDNEDARDDGFDIRMRRAQQYRKEDEWNRLKKANASINNSSFEALNQYSDGVFYDESGHHVPTLKEIIDPRKKGNQKSNMQFNDHDRHVQHPVSISPSPQLVVKRYRVKKRRLQQPSPSSLDHKYTENPSIHQQQMSSIDNPHQDWETLQIKRLDFDSLQHKHETNQEAEGEWQGRQLNQQRRDVWQNQDSNWDQEDRLGPDKSEQDHQKVRQSSSHGF